MHVIKCVQVDKISVEDVMFNEMFDLRDFELFLLLGLATGCNTASRITVMLGIEFEPKTLRRDDDKTACGKNCLSYLCGYDEGCLFVVPSGQNGHAVHLIA